MESNLEQKLFDIPENVEMPIELCHHLKLKLHSVMEQNWHLKRHVEYLDKEVMQFRKSANEKETPQKPRGERESFVDVADYDPASSMMASKIVELSKKNRDMTAQVEGMKTKIKKLSHENDKLRETAEMQEYDDRERSQMDSASSNAITDEDCNAQQVSHLTSKVMEYRRQCQQLRMELKTALRALCQEVGDTATPQNVLTTVSNPSWRGRSQSIIALQQKVSDMQIKLSGPTPAGSYTDLFAKDNPGANGAGDVKTARSGIITASVSSVAPAHRLNLQQQDLKKHELINKLSSQIDQLTTDLKCRQQELKASKARTQTLESQLKSTKLQVDLLESKLHEKESVCKTSWNDLNQLKQELIHVKDREKRCRDQSNLELQETTRSLTRERAIIKRLQEVITEKQDAIQKADGEIIKLKNKLDMCCSNNSVPGGVNTVERIYHMETDLQQYKQKLSSSKSECKRLSEMVEKTVQETETERQKALKSQRESARIFFVLQQANKCIDDCLDAAHVTNTSVLKEVENIRTLIRELKTGELYSLAETNSGPGTVSVKKLKSKVDLLNKEIKILQTNFEELSEKRKKDMQTYAKVFRKDGVKT